MLVFLPASACNQRIIPQRRTTCGRCEALHVIRYEKCAALIEKITQGGASLRYAHPGCLPRAQDEEHALLVE